MEITFARHRLKAKQNSARNNAKCSKCFQFLCNNSDRTFFFNVLTFARSLGGVESRGLRPRFFYTSLGTWRMLMHEKTCLIPIILSVRGRLIKPFILGSMPVGLNILIYEIDLWLGYHDHNYFNGI